MRSTIPLLAPTQEITRNHFRHLPKFFLASTMRFNVTKRAADRREARQPCGCCRARSKQQRLQQHGTPHLNLVIITEDVAYNNTGKRAYGLCHLNVPSYSLLRAGNTNGSILRVLREVQRARGLV